MVLMRWAICGAGNISHDFAIALHTLPKGENEIVAVAGTRDRAKTQAFADNFHIKKVYSSYEEVAQDQEVDVVYVGTFNITHYEVVKLMLNHKKHVLCEKPITLLLKHTEELYELAKKQNRFLMEACWSRFFPAYLALRDSLGKKLLGTPKLVTAQFGLNIAHVERLKTLSMGGGSLVDLGIYTIQFAMLVFGNEMPEEIVTSVVKNEDGVDLSLGMILKYKNGGIAQLTSTLLARINCEAAVFGDNNGVNQIACLKVPHPFWSPTELVTPAGVEKFPLPFTDHKTTYPNGQGMCYEIAETRKCILEGRIESPYYSHQDSLTLTRITKKVLDQIGINYEFIYQ
ncbi:trans-1,2-dihydrobenzene-1,2-diol dehydrogenase-like [Paramacrobiotus metropolitanus]|uniref:trans-1,2-dihydrobenzene-1,2-diol dehydrogenase-like n=1 Tax=Paramacrobiotus metropolitanus TaxID=2943436 RepID=UPI0024460E00|nr:trans-1,2-dihydrobenzene-1,2-diol dehydrogenase-like [Paramacrobiotus metropolitanus]